MTAPTVGYKRNTGPVQRAQGSLSGTYTAASDVSSATSYAAATDPAARDKATLASGVLTITLGFVPTYFKVVNVTDRVTQEWFAGMNKGDFIETAANGTRTLETDDKLVVQPFTRAAGSAGSGGTADTTPAGVVSILADGGAFTDNDTMVWEATG